MTVTAVCVLLSLSQSRYSPFRWLPLVVVACVRERHIMRWENIYLAGAGLDLPTAVSVASAVDDGRYPAKLAERSQQLAVTVAAIDQPPVSFAVSAARKAIEAAKYDFAEIGLLAHAVVLDPGPRAWNSASFIERELGRGGSREVIEVRSGCDASVAALKWAAAHLSVHRDGPPAALITTAESWQLPFVDRWTCDPDGPFGDGGTAVVVSRERGFARLVATATHSEPSLEPASRGSELCGHLITEPVNLRDRAHAYLREQPDVDMWALRGEGMCDVVNTVLTEGGIAPADLTHLVMPFMGRGVLDREYLPPLGRDVARFSYDRGRTIGHMGPGDAITGMYLLMASGEVRSGDTAVIYSEGVGVVQSAALFEIL
jgi:3-oxoacyl-[acyl-carrier-protein] synthase III